MDIFAAEDITLLTVDIDKDGGKLFLGSGVPLATEDDEGRMLRAMRRLVDAHTPLPLQVGVNRGYVFVAEVGTPRRAAYSAMGDTTNTAARICAKAPPGELYAHPSVLVHSRRSPSRARRCRRSSTGSARRRPRQRLTRPRRCR
jgi:class 3 adenylate cyclase